LRINFISLHVTNSADGGRRSYPKLSKCNKTAGFRPIPRGGSGCGPWCLSPPVGECCPLVGVPPSATTAHLYENFTLDVYVDKEVSVKFWKVPGSAVRVQTLGTESTPDWIRTNESLSCPSAINRN